MAYKALYRLYRPQTFDEVVGQNHILQTLKNAIRTNKIAHAYLFSGPRGTGKTSMAKLLAKAVNCTGPLDSRPCNECANCKSIVEGNYPDVIEFDAASNNGVDEIRDIVDKVKYAPIEGQYKVYIIDEVHMMTASAYNAFLKTLEEPPSHVIFILATTEVHKVIPTILSRCQRFDFGRVSMNDLKKRITQVLTKEKVTFDQAVIQLVADLSEGGVRDALGILDQAIAYAGSTLTEHDIRAIYGIASIDDQMNFLERVSQHDLKSVYQHIDEWDSKGIDFVRLTIQLIDLLKDGVIFERTHDETLLVHVSVERATKLANWWSADHMLSIISELMEVSANYRRVNAPRSYFELSMLKLCQLKNTPVPPQSQPTETFMKAVEKSIAKNEKAQRKEPEAKEEVSRETPHENQALTEISDNHLLGYLTTATREDREFMVARWELIDQYMDKPAFKQGVSLLRGTSIAAASMNAVLIACTSQPQANFINKMSHRSVIHHFLKELCAKEVHFYAITINQMKLLKDQYKARLDAKNLPTAYEIFTPIESAPAVTPTMHPAEALGRELFGDLLEIKHEKN